MAKMKYYSAFGLLIESEIELPELDMADTSILPAQIKINLGSVPSTLDNSFMKTPWEELSQESYILRVDGIADFLAQNGDTIIIEPKDMNQLDDVRVFLFNSLLAQLLYQRGILILHGMAFLMKDKAVLLLGHSITGKSSIALDLYKRGYSVINDEICAVVIGNGKAEILPGIARITVWKDTLEKFGENPEDYNVIRKGFYKYNYPVETFSNKLIEISDVVIMNNNNMKDIRLTAVLGAKKFEKLMLNVFRLKLKSFDSQKQKNYNDIVGIASCAKIHQLDYNIKVHHINNITDYILKELT